MTTTSSSVTVIPLTPSQVIVAQGQANALANAQVTTISKSGFTFVAAFDGTQNDRSNPALSGDAQPTAIGQLSTQIADANSQNANVAVGYRPGVGTPETGGLAAAVSPLEAATLIAERNYRDFAKAAADFIGRDGDPSQIFVDLMSFSRGAVSAAIFSQMLYTDGLVYNGQTLIAPEQNDLIANALPISNEH